MAGSSVDNIESADWFSGGYSRNWAWPEDKRAAPRPVPSAFGMYTQDYDVPFEPNSEVETALSTIPLPTTGGGLAPTSPQGATSEGLTQWEDISRWVDAGAGLEIARDPASAARVRDLIRAEISSAKRFSDGHIKNDVPPEAKLHPAFRGLAGKVRKYGRKGALRKRGLPEVAKGRVDVLIWVSGMPTDGLKRLRELGFVFSTEVHPGRLLLGTLPVEKLEALAKLSWVRGLQPPRYK